MSYPTRWKRVQQETGWPFGFFATVVICALGVGLCVLFIIGVAAFAAWIVSLL